MKVFAQPTRAATQARPLFVQRKVSLREQDNAQAARAVETTEDAGNAAPPVVQEVIRSAGDPLDARTRSRFESRLGHDFGTVRVHADARAAKSVRAVQALAYTVGHHVAFGDGRYAPDTTAGDELLAHELVHTTQKTSSSGDDTIVRRRRIPTAPKLAVTMPSGGTD